jgi:hypothetical protein
MAWDGRRLSAPLDLLVLRCTCDLCGLKDRFPMRGCKTTRYDFAGFHHLPVPAWAGVILHDAIFEAFDHDGPQFFCRWERDVSLSHRPAL